MRLLPKSESPEGRPDLRLIGCGGNGGPGGLWATPTELDPREDAPHVAPKGAYLAPPSHRRDRELDQSAGPNRGLRHGRRCLGAEKDDDLGMNDGDRARGEQRQDTSEDQGVEQSQDGVTPIDWFNERSGPFAGPTQFGSAEQNRVGRTLGGSGSRYRVVVFERVAFTMPSAKGPRRARRGRPRADRARRLRNAAVHPGALTLPNGAKPT